VIICPIYVNFICCH